MTRGLKATLFMTNIDEAEVVLKVWLEECNWKEYPAVTLAQVSALPHGAQMQVDLIAVAGRCNTKFFVIDQNPDRPDARGGGPTQAGASGTNSGDVAMIPQI